MAGLRLGTWGGWAYYDSGEPDEEVFVRFAETEAGRMVITELRMARSSGISGTELRRLPLGRIEEQANAPSAANKLRESLSTPRPARVQKDERFWAERAAAGPVPTRPSPQTLLAYGILDVPEGTKKPDEFYEQVAEVYRRFARQSRNPVALMHDRNRDIPLTTLHRWVKEARRRGFLAPGKRQPNKGTEA